MLTNKMPSELEGGPEDFLVEQRLLEIICRQLRRGVVNAEDACERVVLGSHHSYVVQGVQMLPDQALVVLPEVLAKFPISDEGWENFDQIYQFDGNEWSWSKMVLQCRANIEAVRAWLRNEPCPAIPPEFGDRLRTVFLERSAKFRSEREEYWKMREMELPQSADGFPTNSSGTGLRSPTP